MKKLLTLTIGILLLGNLVAQIPLKVYKTLEIKNGDTTEVNESFTHVIIKSRRNTVTLSLEAREPAIDLKVKLDKFKLRELDSESFSKWDRKQICDNKKLGDIEIRHNWLHGYIKIDSNKDGKADKLILLSPADEKETEIYLY